jgi:hypothetical protein
MQDIVLSLEMSTKTIVCYLLQAQDVDHGQTTKQTPRAERRKVKTTTNHTPAAIYQCACALQRPERPC